MDRPAPSSAADQPQEGGRLLRVAAHPSSLRAIRAHVRAEAEALGADADWIADLVLAVDEACQNIIRHGYHCPDPAAPPREDCAIIVETAVVPPATRDQAAVVPPATRDQEAVVPPASGQAPAAGRALVVRLTDFAAPVDAGKIRARDLDDLRPGGLGVHFIRSLTDDCAWVPPPPGAGNVLRLVKRLTAAPGAGVGEER